MGVNCIFAYKYIYIYIYIYKIKKCKIYVGVNAPLSPSRPLLLYELRSSVIPPFFIFFFFLLVIHGGFVGLLVVVDLWVVGNGSVCGAAVVEW